MGGWGIDWETVGITKLLGFSCSVDYVNNKLQNVLRIISCIM